MTYAHVILAVLAALLVVAAWHVGRMLLELRGTRLATCPETGRTVAVDLDLKYSAVHSLFGRSQFRLSDCTRWPERAGCGQMCLGDLEAAPHDCLARTIASDWYAGKDCVYCRRPFGELALARPRAGRPRRRRDHAAVEGPARGDAAGRDGHALPRLLELPHRGDVPAGARGPGGGKAGAAAAAVGQSTQRAMNRLVSRAFGSARFDDHTSQRPSGLKWGKPSKPAARVMRSGSPPCLPTR